MGTVLEGLDAKTLERLLRDLGLLRENLRGAINRHLDATSSRHRLTLMSDKALKIVPAPDAKTAPAGTPGDAAAECRTGARAKRLVAASASA